MQSSFNWRVATLLGFSSILVSLIVTGCSGGSSSSSGPAPKVGIKNPKPRDTRSTVVVAGDSLAVGTGARSSDSKIESCLQREMQLSNVSTVAQDGLTTRETSDLFSALAGIKPRVVVLSLGGNDVLLAAAGQAFPEEETLENLRKFYRQLTDKGVLVIQLGLNPPLPEAARLPKIAAVAAAEGVVYVPDILQGLWKDSRYMTDPIHPNDAGYAKVCERIVAAMKPLYSESK